MQRNFYPEYLIPLLYLVLLNKWCFAVNGRILKKRIKRDQWLSDRITFWQTIYERVYEDLKERGIIIREPLEEEIPRERMEVAKQIKELRKKFGYTQKDLAKKMGVIQQYISKIETGRENVSIDTLNRIADVFGRKLIIRLK